MPIYPYREHRPATDEHVLLDPTAVLAGNVSVRGPAAFGASTVLRGDQSHIAAGPRVVFGSGCSVHVEVDHPTSIGADVWVGDGAVVHATSIGDGVRIEGRAVVLSRSSVGAGSIVAPDSLVAEGQSFPENSYVEGVPGRRTRGTTAEERAETFRRVRAALGLQA
ncbi:MAG: gamma carbonic anhydrase family protein [Chloroflexi bacterium]|nr:gamma carbonic anhydrase family protein [Chloroflexota bacterium]